MGCDNIVGLMYQTGYLTIESYDPRRKRYTLVFPNYEVEVGFAQLIGANFNEEKENRGLEYEVERL